MNNTAVLKTRFITVPGGSRIFFYCFYCHVSFLSSSNIYWNTLVLSACPFLCSFLVHYSEQTCFGVQMQPEIFLMDCRFLQKAAVFSFYSSSSGFFFFCPCCSVKFARRIFRGQDAECVYYRQSVWNIQSAALLLCLRVWTFSPLSARKTSQGVSELFSVFCFFPRK